jgi:glucose 1-dehydrogenase
MNKRSVVITGAAGGIGRATLEHFHSRGWYVIGIDRASHQAEDLVEGLFIKADVSLEQDWKDIQEQISTVTDNVDALVNNAAIQVTKPIIQTSVDEWDSVITSNLRSVFLSVKSLFPLLQAGNGGAIVNVSSVHAVATSKDIAAYAASKGGMLALTRALAIELAPDHIRVNTVLPGAVDTPMLRAGLNRDHAGTGTPAERLENLARRTVSGKIGRPDEIARGIYFLADGEESSFITGQALVIDGGATARLSTE